MIKLKNYNYINIIYEWLNDKKNDVKYSTYIKYEYFINKYLYNYFNGLNFKKLDNEYINNFFKLDSISVLSNSTKNLFLTILQSSIKYGIKKGYRKNEISINLSFKVKNNNIHCLTVKEQKKLEEYIINNINIRNIMILTALYTGVRLGELCALRCCDIDIINNTILINKTVQRIKNNDNNLSKTILLVDKPKTNNSIRIIPVPKFIINYLKIYINDNNNFLFTNSYIPKDPRSVEKYFNNLLKKLNMRHLNFHSLRHTYATRLKENKIDIKVISELLGHSNWKITEDIYVHATFENKKNSIKEFDNNWCRRKFV